MMRGAWVNLGMTILLGAGLFGLVSPLRAGDDPSPTEVLKSATEAMNQGKFDVFAKGMDPDALKRFHQAMMDIVAAADKEGQAGQLLRFFPGVKDVEGLKKLEDTPFFAAYLRGSMQFNPGLREKLAGASVKVLGEVRENPDASVVVYRIDFKDNEEGEGMIQAVGLRRNGARWGMMLNSDVESVTVMLKLRAEGKRPVLPDPKKTKFQYLGRVADGDEQAQLVYRTLTPLADIELKKLNVIAIKKSEPAWKIVEGGDAAAIAKLIREKKAN